MLSTHDVRRDRYRCYYVLGSTISIVSTHDIRRDICIITNYKHSDRMYIITYNKIKMKPRRVDKKIFVVFYFQLLGALIINYY